MLLKERITKFDESERHRLRVHEVIPGGAHTYSKGDDQFPLRTPAAISHGLGSHIWDIDGNEYLDCAMGLTSVSLGHAYPQVVERVSRELARGVNFQRPSYIELEMAEAFLEHLPHHQMIKFAKNGSTVTTAAVKIARAATGRSIVAFPGDHPFYSYDDWFIGKTPCNIGVPDKTQALSVAFQGCSLKSLNDLFERHQGEIACVISEPERPTCSSSCMCDGHPEEFVRAAIELCHKNGALFILDEMVTGYKVGFPGAITRHALKPDMATWGKGIANGFSFCALTGTREFMDLGGILQSGQDKLFLISSTHGGETHAIAAGLETQKIVIAESVVKKNLAFGQQFLRSVEAVINRRALGKHISTLPQFWMPAFVFRDEAGSVSQGFRTLAMQEMIGRGVLFQGSFTPCYSHSNEDLEHFVWAFNEMCNVYERALESGYENLLEGPPAKPVFRKYI